MTSTTVPLLPPPPPPPPLPALSVYQITNNDLQQSTSILPNNKPPPPPPLPTQNQPPQITPLMMEKNIAGNSMRNDGSMDTNQLLRDIERGVQLKPCHPQNNKYNTLPHKPHGVSNYFINSENNVDDNNIKPMKNQLQAELCSTLQRRQKQHDTAGDTDQPKKLNFVTPKNSTINAIYTQLQLKEIEDAERAIQALNATLPRKQGTNGNGNYVKKESTDPEDPPPPKLMISHGKPNFVRVTPICRLPQLVSPQLPSPPSIIQPSRSSSSSSTSSVESNTVTIPNNTIPTIVNNNNNNIKIPPIKPFTTNKNENKFGEVIKNKSSLTSDNTTPRQWSTKNSLPTSGRSSQLSSPLLQRKNSNSTMPQPINDNSRNNNNNSDHLIQQAIRKLKSVEDNQNLYLNMEKKSISPELSELKNVSMPSSGTQSPSLAGVATSINVSTSKNKNKIIETMTSTENQSVSTDIICSTQFNQKEIKEKFKITATTTANNNNNWSRKPLTKNGSNNILPPAEPSSSSSLPRKANVSNPQIYQHSSNISSSNIQHLKKTFDTTQSINKPIVSFSKDLGATPNRYPDMIKVIKTVASSSSLSSSSSTATVINSENGYQQNNNEEDDSIKGNLFFSDLKFIINDNGEVIKDSIKTEYRKQ